MILMFTKDIESIIWWLLSYPLPTAILYNPPFSTLWASFVQFSFGESDENPRVRVLLVIFERREEFVQVFKIFHLIEVCEVRKISLSMKT
jgi:hypothetical protein